jgi:nuclease-like protein
MKVYRDVEYIKKRKRQATLTSIAGVALLGSAFWLASTGGPSAVFIAYIPLLAGTIIFHLGMQQVGKWNRAQRNDVILDALLKDLGERYALIHYSRAGKRMIEHALVHPGGVLTITARELPGGVAYRDGRWRKVGQGLSRFFGMGGAFLGNPTTDSAADVQALQELLGNEPMTVDVDGVVAFINPRVKLDVVEPDFPVTNAEGLKPYIASLSSDGGLQAADRQRVVELLTRDGAFEVPQATPPRRPVKRRAA